VQPALECVDRYPKCGSGVGRGEPFHIAQKDHFTMLLRQTIEGAGERSRQLAIGRAILGVGGEVSWLRGVVLAYVRLVLDTSPATRARAPGERERPAAQGRAALELSEVRSDREQGVLEHIVGVGRVLAHSETEALDGRGKAREELFERFHVTGASALHEGVYHRDYSSPLEGRATTLPSAFATLYGAIVGFFASGGLR
jgi:hypothetical protein